MWFLICKQLFPTEQSVDEHHCDMNSSPRQEADERRVKRKERERDENENCQITVNLISFIRIPFVIVSMESDLLCLQKSLRIFIKMSFCPRLKLE